jgi:uncharacterized protein DUF6600/FecR-like protein
MIAARGGKNGTCLAKPSIRIVVQEGFMRTGKAILLGILLMILFSAGSSFAAQDRYIRLRSVEGEVTIYPGDNQRPNQAAVNAPLLDGDEIQTGQGRAELSFRNGVLIRVGDNSSLRIESSYTPMRLNLTQGTVFVDSHLIERFGDELELRAGDAQINLIDEGNVRVDFGSEGSVRVTSIEGEVEVQANGSRVLLRPGERTYVDPGNRPERPEAYNNQTDELDDWNQSEMQNYAQNGYGGAYGDQPLDQDMYYDGQDLSAYGDWRYDNDFGNVWVPQQYDGWRPYSDGQWMYFDNAWFWVSAEPWGWAPYHYGRWGFSVGLGWYWIPGNTFAPAWVSWYSYGDYVGWCPLNYYNRPVYYDGYYDHYDHHDHGGYYPPVQKQKTLNVANSWNFVKKSDLGTRNVKTALLNHSQVKDFHIDRTHVAPAPQKELVSYVIPKTRQFPGYVNDKRLIKQPEDIKSPVGANHREEQFVRPGLKNPHADHQPKNPNSPRETTVVPRPRSDSQRDQIRSNKTVTNQPPQAYRPKETPQPKDRDWQFKRNDSRMQHYSPLVSPYYRPDNRNDDRNIDRNYNSDPRVRNYNYPERDDDSDRYQDVNPRYRDEAKRYFERFEKKNPPSSERPDNYEPPSRNYTPPSKSYDPPARSYTPPPREYKAPDTRSRPDNSNHSRPNNHSNSDDKPHKPH